MARTFHRTAHRPLLSEINVTPLIDLAFALLIIFMITAPLLEQSIEINLPTEAAKPQTEPQEELRFQTISIDEEGQFFWGGDPVADDVLGDRLAEAATSDQPPILSIRADARIPYQRVITVIDLAKQHNLTQISLDTRVK